MARQAQTAMGRKDLEVNAGMTPFVPKPLTSSSKAEGRFGKQDFVYVAEDDTYRCPAGERLTSRSTSVEDGMILNVYWTSACQNCSVESGPQTRPLVMRHPWMEVARRYVRRAARCAAGRFGDWRCRPRCGHSL